MGNPRWAPPCGWGETHLPPVRVFSHFRLAAASLVIWIVYLITGNTMLAWIAFADLVLVAIIGLVMVTQ